MNTETKLKNLFSRFHPLLSVVTHPISSHFESRLIAVCYTSVGNDKAKEISNILFIFLSLRKKFSKEKETKKETEETRDMLVKMKENLQPKVIVCDSLCVWVDSLRI